MFLGHVGSFKTLLAPSYVNLNTGPPAKSQLCTQCGKLVLAPIPRGGKY